VGVVHWLVARLVMLGDGLVMATGVTMAAGVTMAVGHRRRLPVACWMEDARLREQARGWSGWTALAPPPALDLLYLYWKLCLTMHMWSVLQQLMADLEFKAS
jgi:hypothetical protein